MMKINIKCVRLAKNNVHVFLCCDVFYLRKSSSIMKLFDMNTIEFEASCSSTPQQIKSSNQDKLKRK